MRVAIVGSRSFDSYSDLEKAIKESGFDISEVVCGGAKGADSVGRLWGEINGITISLFPADWDNISVPYSLVRTNKWGKPYNAAAGRARNTTMADYADAVLACWDGASSGTKHMIGEARKFGKPVYVFRFNTVGI